VIEDILPRLDKVKRTGKGNWLACCPAHDDKSPSLTIHEAADGRILVKCFAGCSFEEIKEAVGLGWEPWFPPKDSTIEMHRNAAEFAPAIRRPFPAGDVLEALAAESMIVSVAACNLGNGYELTHGDKDRLLLAMNRIDEGRRLALGERR
jgi:hypothetical protein